MPAQYPAELCRSNSHTFEVPDEQKLFLPRFLPHHSGPCPLSTPAKFIINTAPLEQLRCLSCTFLKYVAPTTILFKFRLSGSYSTRAMEAHLFPLFSLSNPDKIPINTAPPELRCLSGTCLKSVVRTAILLVSARAEIFHQRFGSSPLSSIFPV